MTIVNSEEEAMKLIQEGLEDLKNWRYVSFEEAKRTVDKLIEEKSVRN